MSSPSKPSAGPKLQELHWFLQWQSTPRSGMGRFAEDLVRRVPVHMSSPTESPTENGKPATSGRVALPTQKNSKKRKKRLPPKDGSVQKGSGDVIDRRRIFSAPRRIQNQ
jgi:hypothetical protein